MKVCFSVCSRPKSQRIQCVLNVRYGMVVSEFDPMLFHLILRKPNATQQANYKDNNHQSILLPLRYSN